MVTLRSQIRILVAVLQFIIIMGFWRDPETCLPHTPLEVSELYIFLPKIAWKEECLVADVRISNIWFNKRDLKYTAINHLQ